MAEHACGKDPRQGGRDADGVEPQRHHEPRSDHREGEPERDGCADGCRDRVQPVTEGRPAERGHKEDAEHDAVKQV